MRELPDYTEPQALLAGTLCLLSCPGSAAAPLYMRRIVANLEKLATHPAFSAELRTVCRRLASQWEERLAQLGAPADGPSPLH
jgi:hypothetical protein